jgi:hypothetical protein
MGTLRLELVDGGGPLEGRGGRKGESRGGQGKVDSRPEKEQNIYMDDQDVGGQDAARISFWSAELEAMVSIKGIEGEPSKTQLVANNAKNKKHYWRQQQNSKNSWWTMRKSWEW